MATINLELEEKQIADLTSAALMAQLSGNQRTALIQQALNFLLEKRTVGEGYNKKTYDSPLTEAFQLAVRNTAHGVARAMFEQDEAFKKQVTEVVEGAIRKVFEQRKEELIDKLASALTEAINLD